MSLHGRLFLNRDILFERLASALLFCLLFHFDSVNATSPKFYTPPSGGGSGSIFENKAVGSTVLTLRAISVVGDVLTYSKVSQVPASPGFTINSNNELTVPSGLNFEETKLFTFRFRVSDGATSAVSTYTLTIKDVDDESPVFDKPSYSATIMESVKAGTTVVKVSATDVDSSAITYSIQGAQTIFKIDQSGYIMVANPSSMPALKPSVTLNVQASDGKNQPAVDPVTITITDSPCSSAPCQNGGTCSVTGTTHKCFCLAGYAGDNCQSVDYCYNNPCKNSSKCHNGPVGYTCDCGLCFQDKNCMTDHNPCAHGRCSNNTCHCDLCYKGPQCEEAHNPCKHGTCQNDKCLCQKCYTGQLCDQEMVDCTSQWTPSKFHTGSMAIGVASATALWLVLLMIITVVIKLRGRPIVLFPNPESRPSRQDDRTDDRSIVMVLNPESRPSQDEGTDDRRQNRTSGLSNHEYEAPTRPVHDEHLYMVPDSPGDPTEVQPSGIYMNTQSH